MTIVSQRWMLPQKRAPFSWPVFPRTESVTPERAESLWAERRKYFFKPAAGYGSKAAYRGDKLTRRVWQEILHGTYVAQALVAPSERHVAVDNAETDLKLDIRAYVYGGAIQLVAARLYEGQTTNFRTPGGGFAPVFVVNAESGRVFDPGQSTRMSVTSLRLGDPLHWLNSDVPR